MQELPLGTIVYIHLPEGHFRGLGKWLQGRWRVIDIVHSVFVATKYKVENVEDPDITFTAHGGIFSRHQRRRCLEKPHV